MCSEACSKGQWHAKECETFVKSGFRANVGEDDIFNKQYSFITVLRLLEYCNKAEEKRDLIERMEDHNLERREKEPQTWNFQKELIVDFIQKV